LVRRYGDPGKDDPTREGQGGRPPLRLLASARAAHQDGRIGATILAALLGTTVHDLNHVTEPDIEPSSAFGTTPSALAEEAAAVFADL
jgi:hypothetical protein